MAQPPAGGETSKDLFRRLQGSVLQGQPLLPLVFHNTPLEAALCTTEPLWQASSCVPSLSAIFDQKDLKTVQRLVLKLWAPRLVKASDLLKSCLSNRRFLSTGFHQLDALLNGGLLTGEIAEVFGRSAVGKTQVCHHLVASLVVSSTASSNFSNKSGATALYLDTKGDFDASRLRGLIQSLLAAKCNPQEANDLDQRINHCLDRVRHQLVPDVQELMDGLVETRLLVASSLSSESSHLSPEEALFYSNLRLVIVDCIASPFSPYVGAFTNETNFYLHSVATELRRIAVDFHIAVLLTNNLRHGEEVPKGCLGDFWVTVPHLSLFMSPLEEGRSVCVEIQQNCRTACVGNDDGDGESQTEKSPDSCVIDLFKV